jgi:putative Mg2+ transporter-C (MgtC) family protein
MDTLDIAVRLGAATLVGVMLGLNRDLHGQSTGVRTLGLVCLGSALAVLSINAVTGTDASRHSCQIVALYQSELA